MLLQCWRRHTVLAALALCYGACHCQAEIEVSCSAQEPGTIHPHCLPQSGWALLQTKSSLTRLSGTDGKVASAKGLKNPVVGVNATSAAATSSEAKQHPSEQLTPDFTWSDVRKNSAGDLSALLMTICWSVVGLAIMLMMFEWLRNKYPLIYENNVLKNIAPFAPSSAARGWWYASMRLEVDEVADCIGLDQAMLLEFLHMSIWLLAVISPPMMCMCFLHAFCGQIPPVDDGLGRIDLANIGMQSWLCWLHAGLVWYVVIMSHWTIKKSRAAFMPRRLRWLKELPYPRSMSIMVEAIPKGMRTDADLQKYFEDTFVTQGSVHSSVIVKHSGRLASVVASLTNERQLLAQAEFAQDRDAVSARTLKVQFLEVEVCSERARIKAEIAAGNPEIYSTTGFVTFSNRRDRETALALRCTRNHHELVVSMPPDPSDVFYQDLQVNRSSQYSWRILGNALLVLLFIVFLPICIGISSIARLQTLQLYIPALHKVVVGFPVMKSCWDGLLASTILSCMLGFVPGMLTSIFQLFCLRTGSRVEHYIQVWYYYFLVVFVLFVTVLGNSLLDTVVDVVATKHSLIFRLANNLPMASHFYLQYLVVQSFSYGLVLLRPVPLYRFMSWRRVCDEEIARQLAEPEHDVYNSMGARSAMFSFHLVIALVFCNITPLICIVALASSLLARAFYGYLLVFAEPRDPDMGGMFWCTSLGHVQHGIYIYILLMSSIVAHRSSSWWQPVLTLSTIFYHYTKHREFQHCFQHWDHLPVEDIPENSNVTNSQASEAARAYMQPELQERILRV